MKRILIFLLAISIYGCQEEKKEAQIRLADYNHPITSEETTEKSDTSANNPGANEAKVVEISIEGTDQMTFNKDVLKVPAGSTVKLTLTHTGTFPAAAMGHNVVILKKGTDVQAFAMKAMKFPNNNYIPKDATHVIAHTKIVGGGESTTIEFKAPPAGTYTFICSFPGHYVNMQGKFIVE